VHRVAVSAYGRVEWGRCARVGAAIMVGGAMSSVGDGFWLGLPEQGRSDTACHRRMSEVEHHAGLLPIEICLHQLYAPSCLAGLQCLALCAPGAGPSRLPIQGRCRS